MTDHAEALAKALAELAAERRCTAVMAGRANRAEAELAAYRSEVVAWEATTVAYKQFVTDAQYQKFSPEARRWYKPYRCSNCADSAPVAGTEPAGEVVEISVKPMKLSDGRCDYFVSFRCGDREVSPHVFREQFKAEYHVALYRWAFGQGDEPDLMAFNEDEWPGRKYTANPAAALRDQSEA